MSASSSAVAQKPATNNIVSEDVLALVLGLIVVGLGIIGANGADPLGWLVSAVVWTDPSSALAPIGKAYASLGGWGSLLVTWVVLTAVLSAGVGLVGGAARRFARSFIVVFGIAFAAWSLGSSAHVAAVTPAELTKFGVSWSLKLTNEGGYIIALLAGLIVANFFPRLAAWLDEAIRPELYVKIAIVILGAFLATAVAGKLSFASNVLWRGLAAIIEAYLIYWAVVYYVARRFFGFGRAWAAPLASGISICGVAAAIATGGAIRARPQVAVLVSSLVVVFACVEVLVLPLLAQTFLSHEPMVAAAWMGLAVKTDGAAVAAGGINEALLTAKAAAEGIKYQPGWLVGTTAAVKVFIDLFIAVWTFVIGTIWTRYIDKRDAADQPRVGEIWQRFPKFLIGFAVAFAGVLALSLADPAGLPKLTASVGEANGLRVVFFVLTFFSIGVLSNLRKLVEDGLGRLASVYAVSLFGFVIWVGLIVSFIFFGGILPPLAN